MGKDFIEIKNIKPNLRKHRLKKLGKAFVEGTTSSIKSLTRKKTLAELQAEEDRLSAQLKIAKKKEKIRRLRKRVGGSFGSNFMNFADQVAQTNIGRKGLNEESNFKKGKGKKLMFDF